MENTDEVHILDYRQKDRQSPMFIVWSDGIESEIAPDNVPAHIGFVMAWAISRKTTFSKSKRDQ